MRILKEFNGDGLDSGFQKTIDQITLKIKHLEAESGANN
jgi:hypothetical protein